MPNDRVAPWMNRPPPNLPRSAPCSHSSDSTLSFSLHWCSSPSPCHHNPDERCGCQYWFADSLSLSLVLSVEVFLSFTTSLRHPNLSWLLFLPLSAVTNHLAAPRPWPQSHADWPDVPSLIMNISILIRWTTIAGWQPLDIWSHHLFSEGCIKPSQHKSLYVGVWGFVRTVLYEDAR